MPNIFLFETLGTRENLSPLVHLRAVGDLTLGTSTLAERIRSRIDPRSTHFTYVLPPSVPKELFPGAVYPREIEANGERIYGINVASLLSQEHLDQILSTQSNIIFRSERTPVAFSTQSDIQNTLEKLMTSDDVTNTRSAEIETKLIEYPWDLVHANNEAIEQDWKELIKKDSLAPGALHESTVVTNPSLLHIEEGATIGAFTVLNAEKGPVIIKSGARIASHCVIEGPVFIGEHAIVKPHSSVFGGTTIGAFSRVSGEISTSIMMPYSNKQHEGFLGHSFIASWVNIGAGTTTSNLKNNYSSVRIERDRKKSTTGLQFLGAIIADHAKLGIMTMTSAGTIIGVAANVFGAGFQPKFIPSFGWTAKNGLIEHHFDDALETAEAVMGRRGIALDARYKKIFRRAFDVTVDERAFGHDEKL